MEPLANVFWVMLGAALVFGILFGSLGAALFGFLRVPWWVGLALTIVAWATTEALQEGLRYVFSFGRFSVLGLLASFLGGTLAVRYFDVRLGWRRIWASLVTLPIALAAGLVGMLGFRYSVRYGLGPGVVIALIVDGILLALVIRGSRPAPARTTTTQPL
jgi:hypothetical protein